MLLLVAEKPSVATQHYRALLERTEGETFVQREGYLQGKNHCITWCVGHLITLAPFDQYPGFEGTWKLGNLPMLPQQFLLQPIERTSKQLQIVQGLMAGAETIVNGADAGREGNLIFDLILDFTPALKQKIIKRLWVNSYVAKELDAAWKKLESAEHRINLSYAARLRQRADWMVGLNATRAYTLTAGQGKLISVGRVQTPTLNLIVQRDFQVENFKEHFFYGVLGNWKGYPAQWIREDKVVYFDDDKIPQSVVAKCTDKPALLKELDIKTKSQFPPKPFDLTELQKEANKRFKINVQQVLDIAQVLYEKKVLTYPRTDSQYLPESMQDESYLLAQKMATAKQKGLMRPPGDTFVFINGSKVTDHYAIIPTGEKPQGLSEQEQQVYDLVAERFIVAWAQPYVWGEFQALIHCEQEEFRLKLRKPEQEGYKALVKEDKKGKKSNSESSEDEIANEVDAFPVWAIEDAAKFEPIELHKKKKSKPKYYTEATLLAAMKTAGRQIDDEELAEAMKDRGLGTPATQAGIIETLKKREFVTTLKSNIISTKRARQIIALMDDKVKSPEMTGDWEHKLSLVEKGEFSPAAFRDGIVDYVKQLFDGLQQRYGNQFTRENIEDHLTCPKCAQELSMAPWGYVCGHVGCDFRIGHMVAQRSLSHDEMKEFLANKKTPLLQGFVSKKGSLFGAVLTLDEKFEVKFEFDDNDAPKQPFAGMCPLCKAGLVDAGNQIACEKACGFVLYKSIAGKTLDEEHLHALLESGKTPVLEGFTSKKGSSFSACVVLDKQGKTTFEFSNDGSFHGEDSKYNCPLCRATLKENANALFCAADACTFTLFRQMAGKKLKADEIKLLLTDGKTGLIQGFKSKKGTLFDAAIKFDDKGKAVFDFPERNAPAAAGTTEPGVRSEFVCSSCGAPMEKYTQWLSCSDEQCGYSLPLAFFGKALPDTVLQQLLTQKHSEVLEGFVKQDKTFKAALEIREDGKVGFDLATVVLV